MTEISIVNGIAHAAMDKVILALSYCAENPLQPTGLSSMFKEFVTRSLRQDSRLHWVIFVGPKYDFGEGTQRLHASGDFQGVAGYELD